MSSALWILPSPEVSTVNMNWFTSCWDTFLLAFMWPNASLIRLKTSVAYRVPLLSTSYLPNTASTASLSCLSVYPDISQLIQYKYKKPILKQIKPIVNVLFAKTILRHNQCWNLQEYTQLVLLLFIEGSCIIGDKLQIKRSNIFYPRVHLLFERKRMLRHLPLPGVRSSILSILALLEIAPSWIRLKKRKLGSQIIKQGRVYKKLGINQIEKGLVKFVEILFTIVPLRKFISSLLTIEQIRKGAEERIRTIDRHSLLFFVCTISIVDLLFAYHKAIVFRIISAGPRGRVRPKCRMSFKLGGLRLNLIVVLVLSRFVMPLLAERPFPSHFQMWLSIATSIRIYYLSRLFQLSIQITSLSILITIQHRILRSIYLISHRYVFSYSRQMQRQTSKKETHNKHHEHSLDDFLKNVKRNNLKSERYDRLLSPDPFAPYRQNTLHTLERSRTLSGKHSHKTNKTTRQRVQKMLSGSMSREKQKNSASKKSTSKLGSKSQSGTVLPDPADLISQFSRRIRETEHFLQGKSKMGLILCKKFLEMLNKIVENMVLNFQYNLQQLEKSISDRLQRQIGERADRRVTSMQRKLNKLELQTRQLMDKQNLNNNLIYHLRLQNIDVDREFGRCVYNSDQCGGRGYKRHDEMMEQEIEDSDLNYISNSELMFVKREGQDPRAADQPQGRLSTRKNKANQG